MAKTVGLTANFMTAEEDELWGSLPPELMEAIFNGLDPDPEVKDSVERDLAEVRGRLDTHNQQLQQLAVTQPQLVFVS